MDEDSLEQRVLVELLSIRKSRDGVTVAALARAETICQLLGAGDPYVAYNKLEHQVLNSDLDIAVQAAAASLGFASEGKTHLERLDDFGQEVFLDQRQVRRHSDKGIKTLARLIASNWTVENVPQLTVIITGDEQQLKVQVTTRRLAVVSMRTPTVEVYVDSDTTEVNVDYLDSEEGPWVDSRTSQAIRLPRLAVATSVTIIWQGELWPKFNAFIYISTGESFVESLANKLRITVN